MIQALLNELEENARLRIRDLIAAKDQGIPLIAYNSTYIPEELIRAAGANTYYLCRGGEPEPTEAVFDSMLRFMNPLARSLAGYAVLNLEPIRTHADLIVVAQTDTHYGRISEYMEFRGMKIGKVGVPGDWKRPIALDYYETSIRKLLTKVEDITGKQVDTELARKYFKQTNRINECLRRINTLRRKKNPPISFPDALRLNHLSMITDPDVFEEKIAAICEELEQASGKYTDETPRILVAGRAFAIGDYMVPKKLEEAGAAVVTEMMDEGLRAYEIDVPVEGDLVKNFARNRYRDRLPNNMFQPAWQERYAHMQELIKEYQIDGVFWYQLVFDEVYDMEYSCVAKNLEEAGIPFIKLDSAYTFAREEMGPMVNRIENFVEQIKSGKKENRDV